MAVMRWPFTKNTYWEDMGDVEWLDYVLRSARRVKSQVSDDDGMLICTLALHRHFTVEVKAGSLQELIANMRKYERLRLAPAGRKRKWRLRWFNGK